MRYDQDKEGGSSRKRGRRTEESARSSALQRLKAIRTSGRSSSGYDVKLDAPVSDDVPEKEYNELVASRKEAARSFIVHDDGDGSLGYTDEGEEEDWSNDGLPASSDESDGEGRLRKKQLDKNKEKQRNEARKTDPSLVTAGKMMANNRLAPMLPSNPSKRGKQMDQVSVEKINKIIAESIPDNHDKELQTRKRLRSNNIKRENTVIVSLACSRVNLQVSRVESDGAVNSEGVEVILGNDGGAVAENESVNQLKGEQEVGSEVYTGAIGEMCLSPVNRGTVEDIVIDVEVVQAEKDPAVEPVPMFTLNAKLDTKKKDPALSATAGWKAVMSGSTSENVNGVTPNSDGISDFELDTDGSLPFYILDAHEVSYSSNMGTVNLFGKVKTGSRYQSCCVVVKSVQRCLYAIPNGSVFPTDELMKIMELEKVAEEFGEKLPEAFRKKLNEMSSMMNNEISQQLLSRDVSSYSSALVKRKYAFEHSDIPIGESYFLKISYSSKDPPLPADLKGETFSALLGTHTSALENFLIKRKLKGPSWLSVSKFSNCPSPSRVSLCKFEVSVNSPKHIQVSSSREDSAEIPPVVVTAINLKTIINEKQNVKEIVSASLICCHKAKIDTPMFGSEWKKPGLLSHFTVVRELDGVKFPMGFNTEAADRNSKAGSNILAVESSERALLNRLMVELYKLDSDILVGHNISGFDLDVLLQRAQACGVPSNTWSKVGRLIRPTMPKLTKGSAIFGSGASPGIMSCIAGRLLCDTYLCSRDLLKEVSYSLTELAKTQLNKDRKEVAPNDVHKMFQASESLLELIEYGETDAWLSMELMFHLSVLPLTHQLTKFSGNLWGKTLLGATAQRVEFLLLHAFHAKKYIVPDKIPFCAKETKMTKRKANNRSEKKERDELDLENENLEIGSHKDPVKGKKSPSYAGGLVLEPNKGLYDKYILLLDFNSLYPSIIQEFNICFTTVERSEDGLVPCLPLCETTGVLPELVKELVKERKDVKSEMKNANGLKVQQLDIKQQALKLTANSIYGCLGFSNSRFYAKPLAELITLRGREILQSTVDLVQNNLDLEVVYGDTDSIMIHTGLDNFDKAKIIANKVIQQVNQKYNFLKLGLDGMYKRMLLLKKKKYAAVKVQFKDGKPHEVIERKGLDMVRRDWSLLSKELGDFCLSQILSGGSCKDVIESIHSSLVKVQEDMRNGEVALEKYVVTKSLTKPPEAYPDARNQPHVQVALRLKQRGYSIGCFAGDTVPYIICNEQGATSGDGSLGIAQRARHPDEIQSDDGKWLVDIDYYLSQQIHPVVSRLCASIQGTSPERLADCLGLDSSKFRSKSNKTLSSEPSTSLTFALNDDGRFQGCEPLIITCPSCSATFNCPSVISSICTSNNDGTTKPEVEEPKGTFWHQLCCPKCTEENEKGKISPAMIANQVKRQADRFVSLYYKGIMTCDDETCKHTTSSLNLRLVGDWERGTVCPNYPRCNGRLLRKYTEADLYKQLSYYCHLLDTTHCLQKMENSTRIHMERELNKIRPTIELAASTIQKIRDRCAYGWVQLNDLFATA